MDDNFEQIKKDNIKFVREAFRDYKALENVKIIQIMHIYVLIIAGLFTRCDKGNLGAACLGIALLFMFFAYAFFYLADLHNYSTHVYSNIGETIKEKESKEFYNNAVLVNKEYVAGNNCRKFCIASICIASAFVMISVYHIFELESVIKSNCLYVVLLVIITTVFAVNLKKFFN